MSPALWLLAPDSRSVYRRVRQAAGRAGRYYTHFIACCRGCGASTPTLPPTTRLCFHPPHAYASTHHTPTLPPTTRLCFHPPHAFTHTHAFCPLHALAPAHTPMPHTPACAPYPCPHPCSMPTPHALRHPHPPTTRTTPTPSSTCPTTMCTGNECQQKVIRYSMYVQ